jgi:uncharacterized protein (TIGR02118 family)
MSVKLYAFWSAPQEADVEAFEDYYVNVHVPIAARVPGIQKLVLTRTGDGLDDGAAPYYRIAELVWESRAALAAAEATPEWTAMTADGAAVCERFGVTVEAGYGEDVPIGVGPDSPPRREADELVR